MEKITERDRSIDSYGFGPNVTVMMNKFYGARPVVKGRELSLTFTKESRGKSTLDFFDHINQERMSLLKKFVSLGRAKPVKQLLVEYALKKGASQPKEMEEITAQVFVDMLAEKNIQVHDQLADKLVKVNDILWKATDNKMRAADELRNRLVIKINNN